VKAILTARESAQDQEVGVSDAAHTLGLVDLVQTALNCYAQAVGVASAQGENLIEVAHLHTADKSRVHKVGLHLLGGIIGIVNHFSYI